MLTVGCGRHGSNYVVLQKSTDTKIRQLILYYYYYDAHVDGCAWELNFAKRLLKHFLLFFFITLMPRVE